MKTIYLTLASALILTLTSINTYAQSLGSPFQLVSFGAQASGNTALIEWVTNVETSTKYFIIDRTTDGIHYTNIDSVEGAGQSDFQHNYEVVDNNPVQGVAYYRLTEVSLDGSVNRYSMTALTWTSEQTTIKACYEREHINIHINAETSDTFEVMLIGTSGRVMVKQDYTLSKGENDISLSPGLNDGLYIVNVVSASNNNIHFTKKLVLGSYAFRG